MTGENTSPNTSEQPDNKDDCVPLAWDAVGVIHHRPNVERGVWHQSFGPTCVCGWRGGWYVTRQLAESAIRRHHADTTDKARNVP